MSIIIPQAWFHRKASSTRGLPIPPKNDSGGDPKRAWQNAQGAVSFIISGFHQHYPLDENDYFLVKQLLNDVSGNHSKKKNRRRCFRRRSVGTPDIFMQVRCNFCCPISLYLHHFTIDNKHTELRKVNHGHGNVNGNSVKSATANWYLLYVCF